MLTDKGRKDGERYFHQLEPKKEREEREFNKWVDTAFDIFGFDKRVMRCVN